LSLEGLELREGGTGKGSQGGDRGGQIFKNNIHLK
jgi:hypothetical protein